MCSVVGKSTTLAVENWTNTTQKKKQKLERNWTERNGINRVRKKIVANKPGQMFVCVHMIFCEIKLAKVK